MSELNDREFEAVLQLNADYLQSFYESRVRKQQCLYVLADADGPLMLEDSESDDEGELATILPVWSDARLAEYYAGAAGLNGFEVKRVPAKIWNEHWLAFRQEEKILVGFMPLNPDSDFNVADPALIGAAETA